MKQWKLNKKSMAISLLIPTGIGMIIVMIISVGLTLARFSTDLILNTQSIVAANFNIDVSVYNEADMTLIEKVNGKYNLEVGTYKIKIKRIGSSINSKGYSSIMIGTDLYVTEALSNSEILEFTLALGEPKEVSFKAVWGEAKEDITNIIKNNDVVSVGIVNPETEPVEGGVTEEPTNNETEVINDDEKAQNSEMIVENELKANEEINNK